MAKLQELEIPGANGRAIAAALALPDEPANSALPGLLVIHEIFGLNDDIRRIAGRFADAGYVAVVPDLFGSGFRPACILRVFQALYARKGQAFDDLDAAREWLARRPEVDSSRLGIAGFCMGGGFALMYGIRAPFGAVATFYGETPSRIDELEGICPVVAGYGARDRLFAGKGRRLDAMLDELGIDHDVVIYPEAGHSYMNKHEPSLFERLGAIGPMHVGYNEEAANDSWRRMLDFFSRNLDEAQG